MLSNFIAAHVQKRFFFALFFTGCVTLMAACGASSNTTTSNNGGKASATVTNNAQAVSVTLTDTKIEASRVTFSANLPYDFTVTNKGTSAHDFIIRKRVEGPQVGQQNDQGILYIISGNKLPPGATVHFTYGFTQASAKSTLQFQEHLAGQNAPAGPLIPIQVTSAQ